MPITLTRSIVVIIVPAIFALIPYLYLLNRSATFRKWAYEESIITSSIMFSIVVIIGFLFEILGTNVEAKWDSSPKKEEKYKIKDNWYKYLSNTKNPEPVANRYISGRVTILYFELAMMHATFIFFLGIGLNFVNFNGNIWTNLFIVSTSVIISLVPFFMFRNQAEKTHAVLCITRLETNKLLEN